MYVRCPRSQPMRFVLSLTLVYLAMACDRTDPCPHTSACPSPAVCQPDGTCRPAPAEPRLPEATHRVPALDWAIEHGDGTPTRRDGLDLMPLGGPRDAIAHLAFGRLPPQAHRATQAILTLFPHPSWHGSHRPHRVALLAGKDPETVRAQRRPRLEWTPEVHVVRVRTGIDRPFRIDATPLVRKAASKGRARAHLALRLLHRRDETLVFASPNAQDPTLRPQLDLWLR